MNLQLVWFRSDLRIHDNSALAAAAAKGPVVAVFLRSMGPCPALAVVSSGAFQVCWFQYVRHPESS